MAITDIMEIAKQGLAANKQGLATTSNNIANANTPGYSRQRAQFEARATGYTNGIFVGGGVDVPKVIRVHDVFVDRQLVDESRSFGGIRARNEGLLQMENLLTRNGFEVGESVTNFFNAYRELSVSPENSTARAQVLETAEGVSRSFKRAHESLTDMQYQIDAKLTAMVEEVNVQAQELASLNEKIAQFETMNQSPNELLDRRDTLVRNLSEKLGFPISSDEKGHANIGTAGMGSLVHGANAAVLEASRSNAAGDKRAGNVDIFLKDTFGIHKVTNAFKDGEIAGLLQVRDEYINTTLKQLDHSAAGLARAVNEVHREGAGLDGGAGRQFFDETEDVTDYASKISLHSDVKGNIGAVAVGLQSDAPGDNRTALAMADLQNKAIMPNGGLLEEGAEAKNTINETLTSIAGNLASHASKENQLFRHQESIMHQLENYREAVSGVSLEEEAINMMQYQAVFNASAKAMRLGDEMLQTILSIKD